MKCPGRRSARLLHRSRRGRDITVFDPALAPELPLAGGEIAKAAAADAGKGTPPPPRLMSVDGPHPKRTERRSLRELIERLDNEPRSRGQR